MGTRSEVSVFGVTGDSVPKQDFDSRFMGDSRWLNLPGGICFHFDGHGAEAEANLLGFLNQMHAIRSALLQDMADRAEVVS